MKIVKIIYNMKISPFSNLCLLLHILRSSVRIHYLIIIYVVPPMKTREGFQLCVWVVCALFYHYPSSCWKIKKVLEQVSSR